MNTNTIIEWGKEKIDAFTEKYKIEQKGISINVFASRKNADWLYKRYQNNQFVKVKVETERFHLSIEHASIVSTRLSPKITLTATLRGRDIFGWRLEEKVPLKSLLNCGN